MRSIIRVCLSGAVLAVLVAAASSAYAFSEKTVYTFTKKARGLYPLGGLVQVGNALYGVLQFNGLKDCRFGCGTVFRLTLDGHEKTIHEFNGNDGANPTGGLVAIDGVLYGGTGGGGAHQRGTIFSITPQGGFSTIYNFTGASDGYAPVYSLAAIGNTLYGLTEYGGLNGDGTAFSVTTAGAFASLYKFGAAGDAGAPRAPLIAYQGLLYGTTFDGGTTNNGTAFSITPAGAETVLHSFKKGEGLQPVAPLSPYNGLLYGTTSVGGTNSTGTVFSITASGKFANLYNFPDQRDSEGAFPATNVIPLNGILYGTTNGGGDAPSCDGGCGTIFSLGLDGTYTQLYVFKQSEPGSVPLEPLTLGKNIIYGESRTSEGVFSFTP